MYTYDISSNVFAFIRTTMLLPLKYGFVLLLRLHVTYVLLDIRDF